MMRSVVFWLALIAGAACAADYPIRSVEMTKVKVTGGFWLPRLETNRTATLQSNLAKCNETPRIANFTNAANRACGTFGGIPFDDSDVIGDKTFPALKASNGLKLIPYFAWDHREPGNEMQVWFKN